MEQCVPLGNAGRTKKRVKKHFSLQLCTLKPSLKANLYSTFFKSISLVLDRWGYSCLQSFGRYLKMAFIFQFYMGKQALGSFKWLASFSARECFSQLHMVLLVPSLSAPEEGWRGGRVEGTEDPRSSCCGAVLSSTHLSFGFLSCYS